MMAVLGVIYCFFIVFVLLDNFNDYFDSLLNHDFLSVHYVQALCRVLHALAAQVVIAVVAFVSLYAADARSLVTEGKGKGAGVTATVVGKEGAIIGSLGVRRHLGKLSAI